MGMLMKNYQYFLVVTLLSLFAMTPVMAGDATTKTVAALVKDMTAMKGKQVTVAGKVIKVNNGIMKRNFIHVNDGTSEGNVDRVIVTSQQTAKVGDMVSVTGTVVLDTDFGYGYTYPLLVEKATVTVK
jgi:hypothetical protein